ncbi:hypothetical protein GCM10009123_03180 [Kangiella japonica]|uniref:Uncharacterized protein n=1 Tax=Kangiella japonica TaxID=647384 RepID=A0ABN0SU64_9GAMM
MTRVKVGFLAVIGLGFMALVGCNTTSQNDYLVESSDADDYVYVVDYEKMALIEAASRTSHSNLDTVWVNPPIKRIKRSELDRMHGK